MFYDIASPYICIGPIFASLHLRSKTKVIPKSTSPWWNAVLHFCSRDKTPAYAAKPQVWRYCVTWFAHLLSSFHWYLLCLHIQGC